MYDSEAETSPSDIDTYLKETCLYERFEICAKILQEISDYRRPMS